jgi:hypothetical protein
VGDNEKVIATNWIKDDTVGEDEKAAGTPPATIMQLLVAPVRNGCVARYSMSEAQVALFRFLYGFDILPTVTMTSCVWEKYEVACLNFLEFALLGSQRADGTDSFLPLLGFPTGTARATCVKSPAPHVWTVRAKRKIEPSSANVDWIVPLVVKGRAVVVWNAPQASFADIIVILPGEGVLLVQVKCYSDATLLTEYDAQLEMYKMGLHHVDPAAESVVTAALCEAISAVQCSSIPELSNFQRNGSVRRQDLYRDLRNHAGHRDLCKKIKVKLDMKRLPILHEALRKAATISDGAEMPWIKFCLMTTKPSVDGFPPSGHAVHFSATSATMLPIPCPLAEGSSGVEYEVMCRLNAAPDAKETSEE